MNVTDVSPVRTDQPGYIWALGLLFVLLALVCFLRVAAYTVKQVRQNTLVGNRHSPQAFPVSPLVGGLFATSVILLLFGQSPLYMLVVVAGIWAFLTVAQHSAEFQFGLGRVQLFDLVRWSLVVCGAIFFLEVPLSHVIDRAMTALQLPHPEQESVETFRKFNRPDVIVLFLLQAVVISPLIEELFFRGFLYSFLKRFTSVWGALILSAGVFAFAHANLGSVVQLWVLGIVLGVAYEHTGSLLLPMAIHGCFNFITALSLLIEKSSS
jgi:membrane protease YdiL (CAAX protease family)